MSNNIVKTVLSVLILVFLFIIAINILKFALHILVPLAIMIIAAYIVYKFVESKR